jgi:signal peptidase II
MKKINLKGLKIDFKGIPDDKKKMMIKECVFALALIVADWLSMIFFFYFLEKRPDNRFPVIENFFYIMSDINDGVAFGMFSGYSRVFGIFSIIISAAIVVYLLKNFNDNKYIRVGLLLIFAGGVANGVERLIFGYVRDFLYVTFYSNFNVADALVVVGAVFLVVCMILFSENPNEKKKLKDGEKREESPIIYANAEIAEIAEKDGNGALKTADGKNGANAETVGKNTENKRYDL